MGSLGSGWGWLGAVIDLAQFIGLAVLTYTQYVRRPGEDASSKAVDVAKRMDDLESRHRAEIALLTERLQHMPSDTELTRIDGAVNEVRAQVEGMQDLLRRVEHQTNLIHQHLLSRKE